jgi:glutathione S-transferase
MIDFYGLTSPNVQKIFIMLEECGLPYSFKPVDLAASNHAP